MDVALVNPLLKYPSVTQQGVRFYTRLWPPLDLLNISGLLESRGVQNSLVDAHGLRLSSAAVGALCAKASHVILSSSPLDRWQCPLPDPDFIRETISAIRDRNPSAELILFGAHATIAPRRMLKRYDIDKVACGDEAAAVAAVFSSKKVVKRQFCELGSVFPNYGKAKPVYNYEIFGSKFCLLETSRGCPHKCSFCFKGMYPKYQEKSVEHVVSEIKNALSLGYSSIYFIDLVFTLNRGKVVDLCKAMLSQKLSFRWACQTRVDLVDSDLLSLMRLAGCRLIHFGVESGSVGLLRAYNKSIVPSDASHAVDLCKKHGIDSLAFFLVGHPGEDLSCVDDALSFAKKLDPTFISFRVLTPYNDWSEKAFPSALVSDSRLSELNKSISRAYLSFYCRPSKVFYFARRFDLSALKFFLGFSL